MASAPVRDRTIRVAVRSDRRLFRDALAACLRAEPEYDVVGHAADLADLLVLCELRRPDVVLIDLCGGIGDPGESLAWIRACVELARVVVVYDELSPPELAALWRLGVDTLVPCSHGLEALLVVLQRYLEDLDERVGSGVGDGLTEREREIITLVSAGHTVDRIAGLLGLSTSAVANAKRRLYSKLEVASQSQAVARAAALGIVAPTVARVPLTGGGGDGAVVALRGAAGLARQRVVAALLGGGFAFAVETGSDVDREKFEGTGPLLVVLVDPDPDEWPDGRDAGVPVVLVRSDQPRRTEMIDALLRGAVAVVTVDRVAAGALLDAVRGPTTARTHSLPELTARECDILRSIADGHTVRQTARLLGIAEKTVENTQGHLFRKLGARNRSGALSTAHALGLLELVARAPGSPNGATSQSRGSMGRDRSP